MYRSSQSSVRLNIQPSLLSRTSFSAFDGQESIEAVSVCIHIVYFMHVKVKHVNAMTENYPWLLLVFLVG